MIGSTQRVGLAIAIVAGTLVAVPPALATHGGASSPGVDVDHIEVAPDSASLPAGGACVGFTISATSFGNPAEGETVDVIAQTADNDHSLATTDEVVDMRLDLCDPDGPGPATDLGGSDTEDDGGTESPASLRVECVTDSNGRCVVGISLTEFGPWNDNGAVGTVTAWADTDNGNDLDASEPSDVTNTSRAGDVNNQIVCTPTKQHRAEGGRAEFGCSFSDVPRPGVTITGDVMSGPNAEEVPFFLCTTGADGATPTPSPDPTPSQPTPGACGYNDGSNELGASPPGTDIVVFCLQSNAPPGEPNTQGCDPHERKYARAEEVIWGGLPDRLACTPDGYNAGVGTNTVEVVCTASNTNGQFAAAGTTMSFTMTGPGTIDKFSCTTDLAAPSSCRIQATNPTHQLGLQTITGTLTSGHCSGGTGSPPNEPGTPNEGTGAICSDTATISWSTSHPPPECDDGVDNDGDGSIDFPDDAQCHSPDDLSETTSGNALTIRYRRTPPRRFFGQLATVHNACQGSRRVTVRRLGFGVIGRASTGPDGNYSVAFRARRGRFRARVASKTITTGSGEEVFCMSLRSPIIRIRRS